ncbi:SEL1-like repeat protein [Nitrosospira multiformis]|uniref:SEL1-like repeat protein n=1 Tax=Nitrosospira multiformis TaxID=1231 RepID=UPI000896B04C|nr:SEL1-like repeat protein [Nitrosospira multiformis]SEA62685.1 hypothetical protein SAMN05216411_11534 [Nitrosospira multiformis]
MNRPPILPQGLPPDVAKQALDRLQNNTPPDLAGLQNLARLAAAQQYQIQTGQRHAETFGTTLPDGFQPLDKITTLIGHFPVHPDGASVMLLVSAMKWIEANRPDDVQKKWSKCYTLALLGILDNQACLAYWLETGEDGVEPDLIRAFFYYYRAGMHGHLEARKRAEVLVPKLGDFQWIIAPPYLVFPGNWQLVQDKFGEAISTFVLNLVEDRSLTGQLTDLGGAAGDRLKAMRGQPIGDMAWNAMMEARLEGRWSYDRTKQLVNLQVAGRIPGAAPQAPETICFELMATSMPPSIYFGKDEQNFTYYFRNLGEDEQSYTSYFRKMLSRSQIPNSQE